MYFSHCTRCGDPSTWHANKSNRSVMKLSDYALRWLMQSLRLRNNVRVEGLHFPCGWSTCIAFLRFMSCHRWRSRRIQFMPVSVVLYLSFLQHTSIEWLRWRGGGRMWRACGSHYLSSGISNQEKGVLCSLSKTVILSWKAILLTQMKGLLNKSTYCPLVAACFLPRPKGLFLGCHSWNSLFHSITKLTNKCFHFPQVYFVFSLCLHHWCLSLCDFFFFFTFFSSSRCAVSIETLDVTWSLLWWANCVEPKVLCGCRLSDAASERGGGGESR